MSRHDIAAIWVAFFSRWQRYRVVDRTIFLSLRGVNRNQGARPEDMVGLRLYVTKQRLITSRKHHVSAVQRTADAVAAGEETAPRNPGEIVAVILLWLVYFMQEPIKQLEDEFIAMEQKTLLGEAAEPERMRKDLNQLRCESPQPAFCFQAASSLLSSLC